MRLIDADKLTRDLIDNKCFYPAIVKRAIENAPIEDVVARSEVEEIVQFRDKELVSLLKKAKQEVAREIFEELDDIRLKYYEGLYTEEQATEKYLEVQKKYIGE